MPTNAIEVASEALVRGGRDESANTLELEYQIRQRIEHLVHDAARERAERRLPFGV
jgi:hypothetical protein